MELYQLRTFVAVAQEGSLSRAAEQLFTSQPAVSAQIKALEEEFGLKLFERSSSGMTLTPAGEHLWEEAEQVLRASRDLATRACGLKGQVAGRLRLGLNNDGSVLRSSALLAELASAHPQLNFHVAYGTSGSVLQGVLSRDLDAGFFEGTVEEDSIELLPLAHFEMIIVIPSAWAAELARPDWRRLAAKPWAFVSPLCSYYRFIERVTTDHEVALQTRFQVDEDSTALQLVEAGSAISVTTVEALRHHALDRSERVTVWPHFRHKLPLSLCHLANRRHDPMIRALREVAQRVWLDAAPPLEVATTPAAR